MEYCKMQMGCLLIILYIGLLYFKEQRRGGEKHGLCMFDGLLTLSILCLIFDGLTAFFVNHQDQIAASANLFLHILFLLSLDAYIFMLFIYMLAVTDGIPRKKSRFVLLWSPFLVNVLLVVLNMDALEYRQGEISNYSMGIPAYTCFIMAGLYILLSVGTFFRRWNYIESQKRMSIFTYLLVLGCVTGYQIYNPQALISGIGVTVIILGVYLNQENPAIGRLSKYHREMVMGFATLVENRDDSTGKHITRVTAYAQLLAEALRSRGTYATILTKDYINDLLLAAPMHDIGKIAIPDAILQKPGKLTEKEFRIMQNHTVSGGRIIMDTFGHLDNAQYGNIAYQVAMYHHEKWSGGGYPEGLKGTEIPLCARIVAIADVFDAVSEKRCYREALPLEQCFAIIAEGSGRDFEPALVETFLDIKKKIEEIHMREQMRMRAAVPPEITSRDIRLK